MLLVSVEAVYLIFSKKFLKKFFFECDDICMFLWSVCSLQDGETESTTRDTDDVVADGVHVQLESVGVRSGRLRNESDTKVVETIGSMAGDSGGSVLNRHVSQLTVVGRTHRVG